MPQPISSRLQVEDGSIPANSRLKQPIKGFQSLTNIQGRFKPQRVSSSTTPSRQGDSEAVSDNPQTEYGSVNHTLSGQDRHFIGMLEDTSISDSQSDAYFDSYFSK